MTFQYKAWSLKALKKWSMSGDMTAITLFHMELKKTFPDLEYRIEIEKGC